MKELNPITSEQIQMKERFEFERLSKLWIIDEASIIKPKAKYIPVDDVIEMLDSLKEALINNSKCDCTITTDKYARLVDVLVLSRLKTKVKCELSTYKGRNI